MNLLSSRCLLAIAAVVDIALHARPMPVDIRSVEARLQLPPRRLETLLQALVHAKILESVRGPGGGYRLARESRVVTAGEIVRKTGAAKRGALSRTAESSRLISDVIEPSLQKAETNALANLDAITVEYLCGQAVAVGIAENEGIPPGLTKAKP